MKLHTIKSAVLLTAVCSGCNVATAQAPTASEYRWPASQRERQVQFETILNSVPNAASLRAFHDQLGSEPHMAGTPGDLRNINRMATAFRMLGYHVDVHEFWAYLAKPIDAAVQIISPERIDLSVKEDALADDAFSNAAALTIGFNAYSASGDVTAQVVYANYATKDDFAKLKEQNVDCTGKIVIARYGKNFRGYKAKFAQQAGAAGLIIYTDPHDSGFVKGDVYPEGGWANETYIQRGSINALEYSGDPLTPGIAATEHAARLDPSEVNLPRIPVQPIGYGAATEILARMKGTAIPQALQESWQGGLPFEYRLEGGPELQVRLMVKQEHAITKTANVIATLAGQIHPEQKIIIGCHHDAWGHGAGDPLAGTILVFEAARSLYDAVERGYLPARTIVFAAWGAEEYGIIGSTEYCEQHAQDLMNNAVAYINLDAATMGPNFSASAAPSLKRIIEEVTRDVPQAQSEANQTTYHIWLGDRDEPSFGNLGGGSDHVGFYCHLGVPSCGFNAGGSQGSAYHSNYDNLHWYRKVVGNDYQPAIMLTRIVNLLAVRLANAPLLPLDPVRYAVDTKVHLQSLRNRADELNVNVDFTLLINQIDQYERLAQEVRDQLEQHASNGTLPDSVLAQVNALLLTMERDWLKSEAVSQSSTSRSILDERPWFRNLYATSDPESGYAAWMLPALRLAIERHDAMALIQAISLYTSVFDRLSTRMQAIQAVLVKNEAVNRAIKNRP